MYQPSWNSLKNHPIPQWFRDAKFGIYTHWSIYCVPAKGPNATWYPYNMYRPGTEQYDYHVKTYGGPEKFGYKDFIPSFTAEKFDPDEWAELFKRSGAQFAGPVAEHHDGFPMWDTQYGEWNAAKMGPRRDVVGLLEKAIRHQGLRFMTAFHHAENWWFYPHWQKKYDVSDARFSGLYGPIHNMNGPINDTWFFNQDRPSKWFLDRWKARMVEVLDKYQPDLIWYDFGLGGVPDQYKLDFLANYYNREAEWGRQVVVTYKGYDLAPEAGVVDLELGRMTDLTYYPWITDTTVDDGEAWGYIQEAGYKSPTSVIHYLVDNVSKNGHLLLNIGPKPDGTFPEGAKAILCEMGRWLAINGEAIFGTTTWVCYGEGPGKITKSGAFNEKAVPVFTAQDIRFTVKGNLLYAICLGIPEGPLNIETLKSLWGPEIYSIRMLGIDQELEWSISGQGLTIIPPIIKPCEHAVVFRIERGSIFLGAYLMNNPTKFEATWQSLCQYTVPDWYLDGKFGIFIHWGLYAVPAFGNEWYPRNMYLQGTPEYEHHLKTYGPHNRFGYKDFIPMFRAEKYDPQAWADLFKKAGARFVVPVAEHHDGFAMYDSALSSWTAAKMGPKRDLVGELAQAVRRQGMVFGVSSHRAEHWFFMNGGRDFDSDVNDPRYAEFYGPAVSTANSKDPSGSWHSRDWTPRPDAKYLEDWLARCQELVDKYQPQLFWFDWWIEQVVFQPYVQKFAEYYYNRGIQWGKGVAINYKHSTFADGSAVLDIERGQLKTIRPQFWQNDTSVSKNSWGYVHDQQYKTATDLIGDLVDVVSKNGALLLNIGPRPDGSIPQPEQELLLEIGRWLDVNGEAIYGTRPWKVYGEGPTEVPEGDFTDTLRQAFTSRDIRFTQKDNILYAICLGIPQGQVTIAALKSLPAAEIRSVRMLGDDHPLKWSLSDQGLTITPPVDISGRHAVTFRIEGSQSV